MNVPVVCIPLCGDSASHQETLGYLDRLSAQAPEQILIKLLGPGGLSPEAVLTYYDILATFPETTQIVTISYSNLIGADLLLFLAGNPRDIRPNAWCYVENAVTWPSDYSSSDARDGTVAMCDAKPRPFLPLALHHHWWDYHSCLQLIGRHVDLMLVLDRRLEVADLRELLLVDCGELDALLLRSMRARHATSLRQRSELEMRENDSGSVNLPD